MLEHSHKSVRTLPQTLYNQDLALDGEYKVISPLTVLEKLKGARLPSLTWPDACGLYLENK
jgi:hypothetical protein